jgi:hypothetical protein
MRLIVIAVVGDEMGGETLIDCLAGESHGRIKVAKVFVSEFVPAWYPRRRILDASTAFN